MSNLSMSEIYEAIRSESLTEEEATALLSEKANEKPVQKPECYLSPKGGHFTLRKFPGQAWRGNFFYFDFAEYLFGENSEANLAVIREAWATLKAKATQRKT